MLLLRLRAGLLVAAMLVLTMLAALFGRDAHAYAPPPIHGAVVDTAHALTPAEKRALESRIATYRVRTTNEIVVLLLPSLGGETIDDVAYTAFNTWKIGKKDKDNGVLVAIAFAEHKLRIETGKGIEDRLTDLASSHINRERIAPFLKQGRAAEGIGAGLDAIEAALDQRPAPPLPDAGAEEAGAPEAPSRPLSKTFWFALHGVGLDAAALESANASAEMADKGWSGVVFVLAPTFASFDRAQVEVEHVRSARHLSMFDSVAVIAGVQDRKIYLEARHWSQTRIERTYGAMESALAQAPTVDRAALESVVALAVEANLHADDDAPKPPPETKTLDGFQLMFGLVFVLIVSIIVGGVWHDRRYSPRSSSSDSSSSSEGSDSDSSSSDSSFSSFSGSSSSDSSPSSSSDSSYTGGGGSSGGGGSTDSW